MEISLENLYVDTDTDTDTSDENRHRFCTGVPPGGRGAG